MNNKLNRLITLLTEEFGLLLTISFGVFLFVLFFQPFPLEGFDINNSLVFVAGLALIVFLIIISVRIIFPWLIHDTDQSNYEPVIHTNIGGFILIILNSVAFAFYLHYVGSVSISFFIMAKIILISLAPPIALRLYDLIHDLKHENITLILEKKNIQKQVEKYEEDYLNKTIDFYSENSTETLSLLIADVVFIRSADNYVEIVYKETDLFKKKLIRNTLKNIEQQIKPYSNFLRCHRISIVNTHFIEKLNKENNNHWLTIKGYNEQIPVSRQYLMAFKEPF